MDEWDGLAASLCLYVTEQVQDVRDLTLENGRLRALADAVREVVAVNARSGKRGMRSASSGRSTPTDCPIHPPMTYREPMPVGASGAADILRPRLPVVSVMYTSEGTVERIRCTLCGERFRREEFRACVGYGGAHPPTAVCETCGDEWAEEVYRRIDEGDEGATVYVAAVALPAD